MTKREAIAWLAKRNACPKAMRRVRKCSSVKQMIAGALPQDLVWAIHASSRRPWAAYLKQKDAAWARCLTLGYSHVWFRRERIAIIRRVLLAWAASR